jgi:hypothetical protein
MECHWDGLAGRLWRCWGCYNDLPRRLLMDSRQYRFYGIESRSLLRDWRVTQRATKVPDNMEGQKYPRNWNILKMVTRGTDSRSAFGMGDDGVDRCITLLAFV